MQTRAKAFTLIELLVVVAIIGILAAVGVVAYNGYTASAKVTVEKTNPKLLLEPISISFLFILILKSVLFFFKLLYFY